MNFSVITVFVSTDINKFDITNKSLNHTMLTYSGSRYRNIRSVKKYVFLCVKTLHIILNLRNEHQKKFPFDVPNVLLSYSKV